MRQKPAGRVSTSPKEPNHPATGAAVFSSERLLSDVNHSFHLGFGGKRAALLEGSKRRSVSRLTAQVNPGVSPPQAETRLQAGNKQLKSFGSTPRLRLNQTE